MVGPRRTQSRRSSSRSGSGSSSLMVKVPRTVNREKYPDPSQAATEHWNLVERKKRHRVNLFNNWAKDNNYKLEVQGLLDSNRTIYGTITTPRGAKYYVRAFQLSEHDYPEGKIVIVKSKRTTSYSDPNSIRMLINGQVIKGEKIGTITNYYE